MEQKAGMGWEGLRKEVQEGLWEHTQPAQFKAFQLKSPGAQQHGNEPVCSYLSSVTPGRKNSHARKADGKA